MTKAVSTVISGSIALPTLFAPDKDAARRFIEFFAADIAAAVRVTSACLIGQGCRPGHPILKEAKAEYAKLQ
jgi:hypothetical protein